MGAIEVSDKRFAVVLIFQLLVGVWLGMFVERKSEVGRLQNHLQEQIRDLDIRWSAMEEDLFGEHSPGGIGAMREDIKALTKVWCDFDEESMRSVYQDIQILQGQVADMQEKKLTATDLEDLSIAVNELNAGLKAIEKKMPAKQHQTGIQF